MRRDGFSEAGSHEHRTGELNFRQGHWRNQCVISEEEGRHLKNPRHTCITQGTVKQSTAIYLVPGGFTEWELRVGIPE